MPEVDPTAGELSTQLEDLHRERIRLEELLMLDTHWRALRQMEAQDAMNRAPDMADRKAQLMEVLAANRIFAARARILETIALLSADQPQTAKPAGAISLANRIVMLSEPDGEAFRARLRVKTVELTSECSSASEQAPQAETVTRALHADPLQLIDGLGRSAVELLIEAGASRFADIAAWTSDDVAFWHTRLDGLAHGTPGSWIEQAAVLATGRHTAFAGRVRRGEFAALVTPPMPQPASGVVLPTARTKPPVIPGMRSSAAAMTADELVASLDRSSGARARPAPAEISARSRTNEIRDGARAGYTRPRDRNLDETRESALDRGASAALQQVPDDRHSKLGRRLKALQKAERFGSADYAAYRGVAEEASVTIVTGKSTASAESPASGSSDGGSGASVNRFLRALTGKG